MRGHLLVSDFSKIPHLTQATTVSTAAGTVPMRSVIFGGSTLQTP